MQFTDVSRFNYSPTSNEVYYAVPFSNFSNKGEVSLYSAQIYYPPYAKKPSKIGNGL